MSTPWSGAALADLWLRSETKIAEGGRGMCRAAAVSNLLVLHRCKAARGSFSWAGTSSPGMVLCLVLWFPALGHCWISGLVSGVKRSLYARGAQVAIFGSL